MRSLLVWLTTQYAGEAPILQYAVDEFEDDGAPRMVGAAPSWLGVGGQRPLSREQEQRPDDWRSRACRTDADGFYVSPMRCAIARTRDPEERLYLVNLAVNVLDPQDVGQLAGYPDFALNDIMHGALRRLRRRYRDRPEAHPPKWTELSDSQKQAEGDAA